MKLCGMGTCMPLRQDISHRDAKRSQLGESRYMQSYNLRDLVLS